MRAGAKTGMRTTRTGAETGATTGVRTTWARAGATALVRSKAATPARAAALLVRSKAATTTWATALMRLLGRSRMATTAATAATALGMLLPGGKHLGEGLAAGEQRQNRRQRKSQTEQAAARGVHGKTPIVEGERVAAMIRISTI